MQNRKILFIAAAALLSAMPFAANASTSRLEGMALPGDYTKDYSNIYSWPSCVTDVGNLVYGELGNDQSSLTWERAMGAVLPNLWDGRYGVWSLHLREVTASLGQGDNQTGPNPGSLGFDPNRNANQSFELTWGKKFGGKSLGISFVRAFSSVKDELPGTSTLNEPFLGGWPALSANGELNRNLTGLSGGLGFEMSSKTTAEITGMWQSRTYEASVTPGNQFTDNGGSNYLVGGRMMWKWQPNVVVVPVGKYYSFDLSQKTVIGGVSTTQSNTLKGWQLGLAGNWAIGSNDLFVLGGTLAQNSVDQEGDVLGIANGVNGFAPANADFNPKLKATETMLPAVFMALETQVNSWLTIRMGANKSVMRTVKVEGTTIVGNNAETLTYKDSPFLMNTGAGVKVGNLMFDVVLDKYFFLNPIAQLQGNAQAYSLGSGAFAKVSGTYTW